MLIISLHINYNDDVVLLRLDWWWEIRMKVEEGGKDLSDML